MMKRLLITLLALALAVGTVSAQPATCLLTGNISHLYGGPFPTKIYYKAASTQNAQASIIPGGDACTAMTDAHGNLPTSGNCSSFIQGALVLVTIGVAGQGRPTQIQIP